MGKVKAGLRGGRRGGRRRKEGRFFLSPHPTRIPALVVLAQTLLFSVFPPIFSPPRSLPASPFRRRRTGRGRARRVLPFSPPFPPLISPSNSTLAPVPSTLTGGGPRPRSLPSPRVHACSTVAERGKKKVGATILGSRCVKWPILFPPAPRQAGGRIPAASRRRRRRRGRILPAGPSVRGGARRGLGCRDFPFPAGHGLGAATNRPRLRAAANPQPKTHLPLSHLRSRQRGRRRRRASAPFSPVLLKLSLKMAPVPHEDMENFEVRLQNSCPGGDR